MLTTAPSTPYPSQSTIDEKNHSKQPDAEPILLDRDTMGHWANNKISKNELLTWQAKYNSSSLDGLPGIRAAMRDNGESVPWTLLKARARRVLLGEREGIVIGVLLGVILAILGQMLLGRLGGDMVRNAEFS